MKYKVTPLTFPRLLHNGRRGLLAFWVCFSLSFSHFVLQETRASILAGTERIDSKLPYLPSPENSGLLLSRYAYSSLENHLDGILWHPGKVSAGDGEILTVRFRDDDEGILAEEMIPVASLPGFPLFFSAVFPPLKKDFHGTFEMEITNGDTGKSHVRQISVHHDVIKKTEWIIPLEIPNPGGLSYKQLPVSVGVPMPLGLLWDVNQLSLKDQDGKEVPFQAIKRSHWNRLGSVKWVQLSFVAPVFMPGQSFSLIVASKPVKDSASPSQLEEEEGPTEWWVSRLAEANHPVLHALSGGYVVHADSRLYQMSSDQGWSPEESGQQRVVLKREGWFFNGEDRFCNYVSRLILYKDSPVIRVFHTWIYTGSPEEDRIREMGWRLPLGAIDPEKIYFGTMDGGLVSTDYVQQINADAYFDSGEAGRQAMGGRVTGSGCLQLDSGGWLGFGMKDFWRNFPREIEYRSEALYFREWPRLGHAEPDREILPENALRLWFAHEGTELDFSVPEAYFSDDSLLLSNVREGYRMGRGKFAHTVNAQGVAKTMELLFIGCDKGDPANVVSLVEGLLDGELKAVVDPVWVASSGVFYEMHPRDDERFGRYELVYDMHARAPMRWIERMALYGKWIWGDMTWSPDLPGGNPGLLYRGFRKAHQGWPYSWIPFARSGSTDLRNMADAATRHMADVPYIHYADERAVIAHAVGDTVVNQPRERGRMIRYHIPWGSHQHWRGPEVRGYTDKVDYLWHAYYLNDYWRARDVVLDWGELTKKRERLADPVFDYERVVGYSHYPRNTVALLQAYVQMYEETFDPWFLAAAYQIAYNVHLRHFNEQGIGAGSLRPEEWFWQPGLREFQRFSQSPDYLEFYLAYADRQTDSAETASDWGRIVPMLEAPAFGYWLTGEDKFTDRIRGWLEYTGDMTYTGEPDYWKGARVGTEIFTGPNYTPYYLNTFPYALAALANAPFELDYEPNAFFQLPDRFTRELRNNKLSWSWEMPEILIHKDAGNEVRLRFRIGNPMGRHPPDSFFTVEVIDPRGAVLERMEGVSVSDEHYLELSPQHVPGVYQIRVSGKTSAEPDPTGYGNRSVPSLLLPLSSAGTPEVIRLAPGQSLGPAHYYPQYWFNSSRSEKTASARIVLQDRVTDGSPLVKATLRTVDGRVLWLEEFDSSLEPEVMEITVPLSIIYTKAPDPELAGLVLPFYYKSLSFGNSDAIYLAASPGRWFNPKHIQQEKNNNL